MADVTKALEKVRGRIALLGRDLTRSAIFAALNQEGVQDVELKSPLQDTVADLDQVVWINSAQINVLPTRAE
jgi:phage-related baseplate assembly protein